MDPSSWLFDGWQNPVRTLVVGVLAYASLILVLRVSGKRTLSKMNAFDLIVTIALGSTLASALLTQSVTLAQAITAFALLVFLQFLVTFLAVRWRWVKKVVASEPTLLVYRGRLLEDNMKKQRVPPDEITSALRESGVGSLEDAEAMVLEADGSITVLTGGREGRLTVLDQVPGIEGIRSAAGVETAGGRQPDQWAVGHP